MDQQFAMASQTLSSGSLTRTDFRSLQPVYVLFLFLGGATIIPSSLCHEQGCKRDVSLAFSWSLGRSKIY